MWTYSETQEAETFFLALAARLRHQQQQPLDDDWEGLDAEEESCADDVSMVNAQLTEDSRRGLKKVFLDRFAELLARRKDARFVSCAALVECCADGEDRWELCVARNHVFDDTDNEFFEDLARDIRAIADCEYPCSQRWLGWSCLRLYRGAQ